MSDAKPRTDAKPKRKKSRIRWRPWLRAMHRDIGYLAIGLTLVYALSGLAVNHIADWDPSFRQIDKTHQVKGPFPREEKARAQYVLDQLGRKQKPKEVFEISDTELEIVFEKRTLHVDTEQGEVLEEGQEPRFMLRAANWLHLNRGKKAWTWIADGYAVFLLFLALSGLFMIPGRKGLIGRGAVLAAVGAAVPIAYVVLSGGP